jgi:DNA-binding PadR family transcriptional regulator
MEAKDIVSGSDADESAKEGTASRFGITPLANRRITKQSDQILATLARNPMEELSGSDIARATGLKSGSLYPALLRMHRYGLLNWRWEDVDPAVVKRPRKRLYRLSGEGERVAAAAAVRAQRRAHVMRAIPSAKGLPL